VKETHNDVPSILRKYELNNKFWLVTVHGKDVIVLWLYKK
jgi:hypothetical protein